MFYFFSDVHLGVLPREQDKPREQMLLDFLKKIQLNCKELVIVGDLFDYWFEYKSVIPKYYYRTISALESLRDNGVAIEYLMGNHDFGHVNFFERELGIKVHEGDIEKNYLGKKFFISHGDGKGRGDTGYKILKKIMRNRAAKWAFRQLHPDLGIYMASSSSKTSRSYTSKKDEKMGDFLIEYAEQKIVSGFDYVVMGHLHKAKIINFGSGRYVNLGEWIKNPTFGMFNGQNFRLMAVSDFLKGKANYIREINAADGSQAEVEIVSDPINDEYAKRVPGSRRMQ